MVKLSNPVAFTPLPVTVFTTLTFVALFAALLTTHHILPPSPKSQTPAPGVNLTTAWHDLQLLSNGFHPYNSQRNDQVRTWLLSRIDNILQENGVMATGSQSAEQLLVAADTAAHVFDDQTTNLTFSVMGGQTSVAFTGTNIMVYIRGTNDPAGAWWTRQDIEPEKYVTMVNAHFDSVPSGYGATDDGVGVICVLQLISHFTTDGRTPKRGIIALLNNGEEDYLNGAYAFSQHPVSRHVHTFLNLEGAGAGGRAALFRSTDAEVTKFYKDSPYPFGTVLSGDGFKRHLIRSDTDYSVFYGALGMRGLDVAFLAPRSRYHTVEDSARYTSLQSVWHMLSAALSTMEGLASDTSSEFVGRATKDGGVESGQGSDAVWFDLLGRSFAIFKLHDLFAISVTLLVVAPVLLILLTIILSKSGKWYLFARKAYADLHRDDDVVALGGWRSFFRIPIVMAVSSAAVIGLALLTNKVNPYIAYSSEYSIWSMMLTAWFFIAWFILRGCDATRPSALQRTFAIFWTFILMWVLLVGDTVAENNFGLAGGYWLVLYFGAVFVAMLISYLELFALPSKTRFAQLSCGYTASTHPSRPGTSAGESSRGRERPGDEDDEAHERTSLLRSDREGGYGRAYGAHNRAEAGSLGSDEVQDDKFDLPLPRPYGREQNWSGNLPSWTWLLQFLLLVIVPVLLVGQVALLMGTSLHQTPADGNNVLTIYLLIGILSVFLLLPIMPFIHRFQFPIPTFLLLICVGTLIYNLFAFPFSDSARLKVYFVQRVNLDTGFNQVSLTGLSPYVQQIAQGIPSAAGQELNCTAPDIAARSGLTKCGWQGPSPNVLNDNTGSPQKTYQSLVSFNVTRTNKTSSNEAIFHIRGRNTRGCRLLFDTPIRKLHVDGYASDSRFPIVSEKGATEVRLWTRQWGGSWIVNVTWDQDHAQSANNTKTNKFEGRVMCFWSDANDPATIPAFTEVMRFMPAWSMATKLADGLVEGYKKFSI